MTQQIDGSATHYKYDAENRMTVISQVGCAGTTWKTAWNRREVGWRC